MADETEIYDVVIIGAGAAGIGMAATLRHLGVERYVVLERHGVGASFTRWPAEMRLITPSFNSNAFGLLDLNAVAPGTSPGWMLDKEHPSGAEYAAYLQAVVDNFSLPVRTGVEVRALEPYDDGFVLRTADGVLHSRFVIWAAGEYQYPRSAPFPGAEECLHTAQVRTWQALEGADLIIIGGYESGIDAAINLARLGKHVRVLDQGSPWSSQDADPSKALSHYTLERLRAAQESGRISLLGETSVVEVETLDHCYLVHTSHGTTLQTATPPILATGYAGSLSTISHLFELTEHGYVALTEQDESTRTPGLFVAGPNLRHGDIIFCFIYKFRQRFAVVANAIGERLALDTSPLEWYRQQGMYLDDLSCCGESCAC